MPGEFPSPPCSLMSAPDTLLPSRFTPEVSSPQSKSYTPGVLLPCGDLTFLSPPTPWKPPSQFSTTPEALVLPSASTTTEVLLAGFYRCPVPPSLSLFYAPWRPPSPAPSASSILDSEVALSPAASPTEPSSAPLSYYVPDIAVHFNQNSLPPPCGLDLLL